MSWRGGYRFRHRVEQLAVSIEFDRIWCPVETILVETFIWCETELACVEGPRIGGIEACPERFGGLKNEVDGIGRVVVLFGKELHVDFLGVVPVLVAKVLVLSLLD